MHLADLAQRAELLRDPDFRRRFAKQWTSLFLPRIYHRDLRRTTVIACPDPQLVGRSFAEVAQARGQSVTDVFLDACADHGAALRWHTQVANDRPEVLQRIVGNPDVLIGFSDAGAHLRNMAFYNFPLRMLRLVRDAENRGQPFMTMERAVQRLTAEIADWFRIDAGRLAVGARADIAVIRPDKLDERLDDTPEAPMQQFGALRRLVRRNDEAVPAVLVNGKLAVRWGKPLVALGNETGFGTVLRAR